MISDSTLYSLSIFLGSVAMLLIVLYHYLEVNAKEDDSTATTNTSTSGPAGEKVGGGVGPAKPSQSRNANVEKNAHASS